MRNLSDSEIYIVKENLGKKGFNEVAKMVHIRPVRLREICIENKIYYPGQKFKKWEDDIILLNKNLEYSQICENFLPHRTESSISGRMSYLKLKKQNIWTEDEVLFLIKNYKDMPTNNISKIIDRSPSSIRQKAIKIGLKKEEHLTHEEYCDYLKENSDIIVYSGTYKDMNYKLTFKCLKHNFIWVANARSAYETLRCPRGHKNKKRSHLDFIRDVSEVNEDIDILGVFKGVDSKIKVRCKKHNYEWMASPRKLLMGRGCPICKKSHGERKVSNFLTLKNICFDSQKYFENCKGFNGGFLKFDFCVYNKDGSICSLIEYQGEQHTRSVEFFGGSEGYLMRQGHDIFKKYYCRKHGYNLLIINYTDYKNIDKILESEILPLLEGR